MGMEAESEMVHAGQTVHVKALLESRELILRGAVRRTLKIADIRDPRVVDGRLLFEHGGESFALGLPAGQAGNWLKKMTTEPLSLAQKLGITAASPALVHGSGGDPELDVALAGSTTDDAVKAIQGIAIAETPDDLAAAIDALIHAVPGKHLWVIFPKGAKSPLPESAVRSHMRALGYVDTKACAVSGRLTASRFSPRR